MIKKLIIILLFSLTSCLGTKKISEKTTSVKQFEKKELKKDSATYVNTNQAIKDRIVVNVPEANNAETKVLLDAVLKQLNTSKSSGTNSYISRYDEETRQLVIDFIIAQTQNKETTTNKDSKTDLNFERKTDEYIKKKITLIPWWVFVIAAIFFIKPILNTISILFPQIKTFKWVSKLLTSS